MAGSFRRLIRNLRKANESLEACAGTVDVYEDCPGCGAVVLFKFLAIPKRQTMHCRCPDCQEMIRFVKTIIPTPPEHPAPPQCTPQ